MMYFQLIDNSNAESPKELVLRTDDIICIEKSKVVVGTEGRNKLYSHVIILHMKTVISKKSNDVYLKFKEEEERNVLYEHLLSLIKPESFVAKWQLG